MRNKITTCEKVMSLKNRGLGSKEIANLLGVGTSTVYRRLRDAQANTIPEKQEQACFDFELEHVPEAVKSIKDILEDRKKEFARKELSKPPIIQVKINIDGPIAISHFGDPHLDDPGTNIARIESDLNIIKKTNGMFGANVGDVQNNWVGRLQRLYGDQESTKSESWKLVEWFIREINWIYLVGGNHDAWSGGNDPLYWITKQANCALHYYGVRLNLNFPNGRQVRINARHDFKGNSQWNPAHGPMKAIQMGWRDHILTCGHIHQAGMGVIAHPDVSQRMISWAIRVPSYKILDSYAEEIGAAGNFVSPCCSTIIDPYAQKEEALVTPIWDLETAADFLNFKRSKF